MKAYESTLVILQKLANANPTVTLFQSDLAASHHAIGLLLSETGKPAEAMKAFESALAIQKALADANPTVILFQTELGLTHNNLGVLLDLLGRPGRRIEGLRVGALAIQRKRGGRQSHRH